MADINRGFNPELDKITEREVVPNFTSRLPLGEDFTDEINISGNTSNKKIISKGKKLKDGLLINFARTFDLSDIENLDTIATTYAKIAIGDTGVSIENPNGYTLYRIVQEKTKQDVTDCFEKNNNIYTASFDVPATQNDVYKAYFYKS